MEFTYENILKWFDDYFEEVRRSQGALETVPNLKKYFAPDLQLMMYTAPSAPPVKPMTRDALLLSFVHPGLHEDVLPHLPQQPLNRRQITPQWCRNKTGLRRSVNEPSPSGREERTFGSTATYCFHLFFDFVVSEEIIGIQPLDIISLTD